MKIFPYRKVVVDKIKIFKEDDDVLFDFDQLYCADNIINEARKKISLHKKGEYYKILAEETKNLPDFLLLNKLLGDFINRWSETWGSKNLQGYMKFYDENFASGSINYYSWLEDKKKKFYKTENIQIIFDKINVTILKPTKYSVTFKQNYNSKTYSDVGIKELIITGCPGDFKIVSEFWRPLS